MDSTHLPPARPAAGEPLRWALFRSLEWFSDLRGNAAAPASRDLPQPAGQRALWVFVSTIGELNATVPLLHALHERLPQLRLVLITDHEHYQAPYLAQFPDAVVYFTAGHSRDARRLARHLPPELLVVAEIPCLPSDAPCRFSFAFMRAAKHNGARLCLVNGWLYHYRPACRMDDLETRLFRTDYVRLFDVACVQNEEVRGHLIEAGADPERVVVTGNIKFDAMRRTDWSPERARSPVLLAALLASGRPTVVAGCVTDYAEQHRILDAFVELRVHHPEALLVLAPRHPEVREHMVALQGFLAERGLEGRFRSRLDDAPLADSVACLVLDTIGELKDFYAAATLAYVGVDHNILEPLSFEKPVTVGPGWEKTYPSYPVYLAMREAQAVLLVDGGADLSHAWRRLIDRADALSEQLAQVRAGIESARGATRRCLAALGPWLQSVAP